MHRSWHLEMLLVTAFAVGIAGCADATDNRGAQAKPGFVSGTVYGTDGEPLPGAGVLVRGVTFAGGENTTLEGTTGPDGTYSIQVPDGRYSAKAWIDREYNGRFFSRLLHHRDGRAGVEVDSTVGGTIDFEWRLSGLSSSASPPGSDYTDFYGAAIDLSYCGLPAQAYCDARYTTIPADVSRGGAQLVITLTPAGPLVDGSAGAPLTFEDVVAPLREDYPAPSGGGRLLLGEGWEYQAEELWDIPLGDYNLSAEAVADDGTRKPFKLGLTPDDVEHTSVPVVFTPWDGFQGRSYSGGGINLLEIYIRD